MYSSTEGMPIHVRRIGYLHHASYRYSYGSTSQSTVQP